MIPFFSLLCQHNLAMCYSTEMRTWVDMAGYLPFFATFKVIRHEVAVLGALSSVPTMEHAPDSLQLFFPVDTEDRSHDSGVFEFFFTTDFLTVKPGRAASRSADAATCPVAVLVVILNV